MLRAILCCLLLASSATTQEKWRVVGLRQGESATPADLGARGDVFLTHIVDVTTGRPIEGALVSTWVEHLDRLNRIGEQARTGAAGDALLRRRTADGREADKCVVSAPGYAARAEASSVLDDTYELWPSAPVRGRVLDLDGEPVPLAVVATRTTCAHDQPAAQTISDARGFFVLDAYPVSEFSVRAARHGGQELDDNQPRREAAIRGYFEIFMPAREPVVFRIIGPDGRPLAGAHLASPDRPVPPVVADADGRCVHGPMNESRDLTLRRIGPKGTFGADVYPRDAVLTLASFEDPPHNARRAALEVALEGARLGEAEVSVQVVDSDGVVHLGRGPHDVAQGEVVITVGSRFSGIQEETRVLQVGAEGSKPSFTVRREVALRVLLPKGGIYRAEVQADRDSVVRQLGGKDSAEATVHVPHGSRVVILGRDGTGATRRAVLDAARDGASLDLSVAAAIFRPALDRAALPRGVLRVRVRDDRDEPIAAFEADGGKRDGDDWLIEAAAGLPRRVSVHVKGHVQVATRAVPVVGKEVLVEITAPRLARVEFELPDGFSVEKAERDGLWPGRRTIRLQKNGEPDLLVALDLLPGEVRQLVVRK